MLNPTTPSDPPYFSAIAANGFLGAITPGIPHDAKLSERSKVAAPNLGKVPGMFLPDRTWCGLSVGGRGMNDIVPKLKLGNYKRFDGWPTRNVCLLTTDYPCADVDVPVASFMAAFEKVSRERLGETTFRFRKGTAQGAYGYRFPAGHLRVQKVRVEFKLPDHPEKVAIDFLAAGFQYVIAGTHTKGKAYGLRRPDGADLPVTELKPTDFAEVTPERWLAFVDYVESVWLPSQGATEIKRTVGKDARPGSRVGEKKSKRAEHDDRLADENDAIDAMVIGADELKAADYETLKTALAMMPNEFNHQNAVNIARAYSAAIGLCYCDDGTDPRWQPLFEFARKWRDPSGKKPTPTVADTDEWLIGRLLSFRTSRLGADYIYRMAHDATRGLPPDQRFTHVGFDDDLTDNGGDTPQRDKLVAMREGMSLWRTPGGSHFATVERDGHQEHLAIGTAGFRNHLVKLYMAQHNGASPSASALSDAMIAYQAHASRGPRHETYFRTAEVDGKIYIDLGDETFRAVEITPDGWSIVAVPPVKFMRPTGQLAMPEPQRGGSIDALRPFVSMSGDDFKLYVACMVAALRPRGPYPILNIMGVSGAAKTTGARVFGALVDPHKSAVTTKPKKMDAIVASAVSRQVVSIDNVSYLSAEDADILCQISTGIAWEARKLYTDSDVHSVSVCRPTVLNGIADFMTRSDYASRAVTVTLRAVEKYETEAKFWKEFDGAHPAILGALFDGTARALRDHEAMAQQHVMPRMADFASWAMASFPAFGWKPIELLEIFNAQSAEAAKKMAEANELVQTILTLVNNVMVAHLMEDEAAREDDGYVIVWEKPCGELLGKLNTIRRTEMFRDVANDGSSWPVDATRLGNRLRRDATILDKLGVKVDPDAHTRDHGRARIVIIKVKAS